MRTAARRATTALATVALAGAAVVLGGGPAAAHVTVDPSSTEAGSYTLLTFAFSHGCDGLPTTELRIKMPEQIITAAPTMHAGWHVVKMFDELEEPVDDGHGDQHTTRVSEVVWHAHNPVEDGYRDAVSIQVKLPDAPGETLYFPVVQICGGGTAERAWIQRPEEGQDPHELDEPAPSVTITGADDDASASGGEVVAAAADDASAVASGSDLVSWVALAAAAAGLVLGAVALAGARRRDRDVGA